MRGMVVTLLQYFEARGKLLQIETQEAGSHLTRVSARLIIAVVLLTVAWMMAVPALIALIATALNKPWEYVALVGAGLHVLIGIGFLNAATRLWKRVRMFADSIDQLKKDREWVSRHHQPPN